MAKIKIGYAPTRRSIFSAPDAVKYRGLTADRLKELGIDFVDITDVNDEGLLYDEAGRIKIAEKFKKEKIDGLFLPHCNFGTEFELSLIHIYSIPWGINGKVQILAPESVKEQYRQMIAKADEDMQKSE